ncbi:hypothetical protein E4S40_11755 [Algoriphagus kandeliae]|uniref:Uncharacterized protein n=1 Tax=Algoriphagus kandeliae TaxID=2562278 RepID=A0A4Y9QU38_9BACT|nr:hypothetical protein [Algoriphagus kandeliae]TFV94676.1 hypothetical protein E4S40_11755 [Algoriphagus kandeliae]
MMKNKKEKYLPLFISGGLLIGVVVGTAISMIRGEMGIWLSVGVGGGMALGVLSFLVFLKK